MAENIANRLIGLLVTVAVLAAVYFFLVKPILDTTNDAIDRAFEPFDGIQSSIQDSFDEAGLEGFDVESLSITGDQRQKKAQRVLECVERVQPNTTKMQRCVERFQ